ncbi:MAG TPA: hypothetical protein VIH71_08930 [Solirubrobacteraceae bacterium]
MVVAASRAFVGQLVDGRDVRGQLQGTAKVALVDFEPALRLNERRFGGGDLLLHSLALGTKGIRRAVVALFGVQTDESLLLELERGD